MSAIPAGPNWLLLRGLVREQRHWSNFPTLLAEGTRSRVLTLDLPGVGTERGRESPTSIPGIVDDLRARFLPIRAEDDRPWALFAPSLGGMVTLDWADRYPGDFVHVAVCNTSTRDLGSLFQRFSPEALRTVLALLWANVFAPDPVARERRTLALVSNTDVGRGHAEAFAEYVRTAPAGPGVLVRQLLAGARYRAPAELAVPITVLCSEGDRLCSPAISRALATRLRAPLLVHPTGGHDLPLDDAAWVVRVLSEVGATPPSPLPPPLSAPPAPPSPPLGAALR